LNGILIGQDVMPSYETAERLSLSPFRQFVPVPAQVSPRGTINVEPEELPPQIKLAMPPRLCVRTESATTVS